MNIKNIFIFFMIITTQVSCKEKGPNLILSKYDYDCGIVPEGITCNGNITIYNRGDKPIFINDIYPDCNCIKVDIDKKEIARNDSASIQFTLNTDGKEGEIDHIVTLEANTDSIIHFFTIRASVIDIPKDKKQNDQT